jgi:hypothetical protein
LHECGLKTDLSLDILYGNSHIAVGNKDFIQRNRERIVYDSRWFENDAISLAYLIHQKARSFNKKIYRYGQI